MPRGFVIASDAYRWHLCTTGAPRMSGIDVEAEDREAVRGAILGREMAHDVWSAVAAAYRELALQCGLDEPKVAVRSSSTQDFPGAYESYLNVTGLDELKAAVRRVWASVWNGRAAAFRARLRRPGEPAMAVIVQQMVDRLSSGSATTANPITGNPNRVLVSCASDSGEADHVELDLSDFRGPSGGWEPNDSPAALVAERAVLIEDVFGSRVEVEWARDGERLWILQARPLADLPPYFATNRQPDEDGNLEWRRVTCLPVSPFSRSVLWGAARGRSSPFAARRGKERLRLANGYAYRHRAGIDRADEINDAARAQAREIGQGLRLLEKWRTEPAPSLRSGSARIIDSDLSRMDRPALLRALATASDASRRAVDLVDQSWYPSMRFPKLLRDFLGSGTDGECLYQRLMSGVAGPTIMRDAKLQDLGDRFAAARRSGRLDDGRWWRAFRRDVEAFAREYGCALADAGEAYDVASWRSWVEDAEPVFRIIGALARRGKRTSLLTLHSARDASARRAEEEANEMYEGRAGTHFRNLLALSRGWPAVRSDAESLCALAGTALRLVLVELGRQLVESGVLSSREDVFYLRTEDILALRAGPTEAQRARLAAAIPPRKHELWLQRRLVAPERLPDAAQIGTVHAAALWESAHFRGQAVSAGIATGRVRVARAVAEVGEIENGEILVVRSPSLAWTPFFGIAGGFVSEEEDGLSIAPIALDYGIPAVVGCAGITGTFCTGDRITVDGSTGIVESAHPADAALAESSAESSMESLQRTFSQKTRKSTRS